MSFDTSWSGWQSHSDRFHCSTRHNKRFKMTLQRRHKTHIGNLKKKNGAEKQNKTKQNKQKEWGKEIRSRVWGVFRWWNPALLLWRPSHHHHLVLDMALTLCCVCVFRSLSLSVVLLSQFCIPPDIHARSSTVCTVCLFSPEFFALPPSHGRHLSFQHPPLCCSCALVFSHFASVSLGGGRKEGSAFWSVAALSSFSYFFSLRHPTKYPTHTHTLRLCRLSLLYVRCVEFSPNINTRQNLDSTFLQMFLRNLSNGMSLPGIYVCRQFQPALVTAVATSRKRCVHTLWSGYNSGWPKIVSSNGQLKCVISLSFVSTWLLKQSSRRDDKATRIWSCLKKLRKIAVIMSKVNNKVEMPRWCQMTT